MFTTRSHSQPAPATDRDAAADAAIVLVAHGERGGAGDNGVLRDCASRLRALMPGSDVRYCVLNGEPGVEAALSGLTPDCPLRVFPFFMSEGYFTQTAIPKAFSGAGQVTIHRPLGAVGGVADLVAAIAREGALRLGHAPADVTVVLAAHGSASNTHAHTAIDRLRSALAAREEFASVSTGYLEEEPFIEAVLQETACPTVAVGMFAGEGLHSAEDLPRLLGNASGADCIYTGPVAARSEVAALIANELCAASPVRNRHASLTI